MPGEREARGKGIHSLNKAFDLHEMDSLPLAAYRRSAGNDKDQKSALLAIGIGETFCPK